MSAKGSGRGPGRRPGLASAVLVAALLSAAGLAAWAEDAIAARQALMKENGAALRAIDGIIRAGGNAAEVAAPAERIAALAGQIPGLFPPGSGQGDTEARATVWQKFDDFQARAGNLQLQASLLASAAQSGDLATVRAQFEKVATACSECHKAYRHRR